jgi:F420-dependent oxidoreductase-like protein
MKLALHLNDFAWPIAPTEYGHILTEIGRAAEAAGFSVIAVMDHVWQHPYAGDPAEPVLEAYSTLTWLAAATERAVLLALATPVSYRAPGMLVKTVTTLDVLSGGRAWLGLGVGDYEAEARGLGIPYPPASERYELLEETVQICLQMWSGKRGDDQPFDGRSVQLERTLNLPQSLTRPHPPIMIAGSGAKKTLPLVARYADACNLRPGPDLSKTLDRLRSLCEEEGRDFGKIIKTCPWRFDVSASGPGIPTLLEQLRGFAEMGIDMVVGRVVDDYRITPIELMGREVIPAVAEL